MKTRGEGWRARGEGEKEGQESNARGKSLPEGSTGVQGKRLARGTDDDEERARTGMRGGESSEGRQRGRSRAEEVEAKEKEEEEAKEVEKKRARKRTRERPHGFSSNRVSNARAATTIRSQGRSLLLPQSGDLSGMYYPPSRARYGDPSSSPAL